VISKFIFIEDLPRPALSSSVHHRITLLPEFHPDVSTPTLSLSNPKQHFSAQKLSLSRDLNLKKSRALIQQSQHQVELQKSGDIYTLSLPFTFNEEMLPG